LKAREKVAEENDLMKMRMKQEKEREIEAFHVQHLKATTMLYDPEVAKA
jgi:hypothetical protein